MFSRLKSAFSGLQRLLIWWESELAAVFWPGHRRALPSHGYAVARFDGESLQIVVDDHGQDEVLATIHDQSRRDPLPGNIGELAAELRRRELKLVLRIASDLGVQVIDRLPKQARDEIVPILTNRLDRLTPWSASSAVFDTVRLDIAADGMLEAVIAVVPRNIIARANDLLDSHGLAADVTDLEIGAPLAAPTHDLGRIERLPKLPRPVLVAACMIPIAALAIGGFMSLGLTEQRTALERMRDYAAALEDRLADLPELHARIRAIETMQRTLDEIQLAQPSSLVVLESLSRALPDDAWLDSLTLDKRRLTFSGHARNASELPGLMEAVRMFDEARFIGPIDRRSTLADGNGMAEMEHFSMQLNVRPGRTIERDPNSSQEGPAFPR